MRTPGSGGGLAAILYTFSAAAKVGPLRVWRSLRSRNACKTCALGMGGQRGGMVNEAGHFPEFCKKSVQAIASDLRQPLHAGRLSELPLSRLAAMSPRELEALGRLVTPMVLRPGDDRYRAATWDEAIAGTAAAFKAAGPERSFFYVSGRSSNEAGFLLSVMARAFGTNHVNNCSYYCHNASAAGLTAVLGGSAGTIALEDLDRTDLLVLIGANPASNHPRFMKNLVELRRRGGRVVVVNPIREVGLQRFRVPSDWRSLLFGSKIADLYVQPHAGGDAALAIALTQAVVRRGGADRAYLDQHTTGSEAVLADLERHDPAALAQSAGVATAEIEQLADWLCRSKATVFAWAMGVTHHRSGTDAVKAIAQLALIRGMVGRPGGGLLPLRGHSNIQGLGTVGVTPKLKESIAKKIAENLGITIPATPGMDTLQSLTAAADGRIDAALCLGGNLAGASPEPDWAGGALGRIPVVTYLSTALNTGHVIGRGQTTWILPVSARDEETQSTTQESMFSYIRLSDGGVAGPAGPRAESAVLADLAERLLGRSPIDWSAWADHQRIRQAIAAAIPGLEGLATIGSDKREFHITGRRNLDGRFATSDGKAHLAPIPLPAAPAAGELRLTTIRSEGQYNSVVYEDHDRYRGTERRDVVLMAADDLARLKLSEDQPVQIRSSVGTMTVRARRAAIRAGTCAMYYPEANVLVPRTADPASGTPAFKSVAVTVVGA
ncbi:formate dehydrogenase [Planctomycetota bacterium]|nr:formate dehydrogenase [Planctomycetota bacterium]